ncbi:MAG TPA: c-type cytochrome domain-containing protein, partial [Segetibacter sp.]|nr:c-type cytochrome domain-containing protein [Segetibacter sp.]
MIRWKNIIVNITFALNCLLLFFLIFSDKLVIPAWLQVGGRMHPLLLHFPIVIIILYALWILFALGNSYYSQIAKDLLLLSAVTSVVTALCGLLLSREAGYDADALQTHKWAGCIISFLLLFWYWFSSSKTLNRWFNISASFIMLLLITIAGDLGAEITHGANFLMAPVTPAKEQRVVMFEDAFVYADVVQPVLEAKCLSCHNSKKAKGQLVMETAGLLLKGGKDGKLWDTSQPDLGLLMRRIHLPEDEKEHMPPSGKPQLTDEEVVILERWIKSGADMNKKVIELGPADTLRQIAYKRLKAFSEEKYDFAAADENTIK